MAEIAGPPGHRSVLRRASAHTSRNGALQIVIFSLAYLVYFGVRAITEGSVPEADANARDPVLAAVPAERRATLVAKRQVQPGGVSYLLDIRMQGPKETVFFDL